MPDTKDIRYVKWPLFWSVITIITIVIGYLFTCLGRAESKVENFNGSVLEIKTDISSIKTDIGWIKSGLDNGILKKP